MLSLSRTRAFIFGVLLSPFVLDSVVWEEEEEEDEEEARCWPICSGSSRKVGIVRLGRKCDGCLSRVETVRLKAWRLVFRRGAMVSLYAHIMYFKVAGTMNGTVCKEMFLDQS